LADSGYLNAPVQAFLLAGKTCSRRTSVCKKKCQGDST
jgi:hypothetical protein